MRTNRLKSLLAFIATLAIAPQCSAAIIEVNLTVPLSSAEYSVPAVDDQAIRLSAIAPSFIVSDGDTVRVKWTFTNGDTFRLLPDPHIGLQGWLLLADPLTPSYSAQFGPSWSLLDGTGASVLSGSEQIQGNTGGDLHSGGLTVALATAIDVSGIVMELSNITDISSLTGAGGGLPVEFNGARFLIHNAQFGSPFASASPEQPVPEPATFGLLMAGFIGFLMLRSRPLAPNRS
jgi:hypothetical protein